MARATGAWQPFSSASADPQIYAVPTKGGLMQDLAVLRRTIIGFGTSVAVAALTVLSSSSTQAAIRSGDFELNLR
jgi:hypothetical protein